MMITKNIFSCFTCGLLAVIVKANTDERVLVTTKRCPDPFVFVADKCYWFYRGQRAVDQMQAQIRCKDADARLAQITDEVTQTGLAKWIRGHEFQLTSYWIGLVGADGNGEFRWSGESDDATYTSWGEGQPGVGLNRKCVVMSATKAHDWESATCTHLNLFICEKELPPKERTMLLAHTNNLDQFCDYRALGYYAHPMDCTRYILCFGTKAFSYRCPHKEIFSAHSSLCETPGSGVVCHIDGEATTTSALTTTAEPSATTPDTDDEYEYGGEEYEIYEIEGCEELRDEAEEMGDFRDYLCDQSYMKFGKKCYRIFYGTVNWNVANQICIGDEGGRLAMIKSAAVQEFITDHLKRSIKHVYDFWIGLNDLKTPDRYVWSDGSILCNWSYENWSKTSKKRHRDLKKCVQIGKLSKARWDDTICSNENGYICEKDAMNSALSETYDDADSRSVDDLPPGWKSRNSLCGTSRRLNVAEAVIGGQTADISEHPWQASLRSLGQHRCGGTLIDKCWILTAAHCVDPRSTGHAGRPTLVVLGDVDTSVPEGTEKFLAIDRILLHPSWTATPVPIDDIALVKLRNCGDDINPICLPGRQFDEFTMGDECVVAGWGTMDNARSNYPNRLQEGHIPILSQGVCEQKYTENRKTLITESMFCAGNLRGGIDACRGDSGGPLACRGVKSANQAVQWGIVSWGFGCAQRDRPGVYTRVASYMDWIRNETMIDF